MKIKYSLITLAILASTSLTACNQNEKSEKAVTVTTESTNDVKAAYTIGFALSEQHKNQFGKIDLDAFEQGFRDSFADKDGALTEDQMKEVMEVFAKKRQEEMKKEFEELVTKNKEEGAKFLEENAKKEGIQTTESGLQYKVIKEGEGEHPTLKNLVKVKYEGKLINGDVFDSNMDGEPVEFMLEHMIEGWKEGIPLMKKGATYEFFIPSDLAYGKDGNMGIEPNSTLTFTVELLDIKEAPAVK